MAQVRPAARPAIKAHQTRWVSRGHGTTGSVARRPHSEKSQKINKDSARADMKNQVGETDAINRHYELQSIRGAIRPSMEVPPQRRNTAVLPHVSVDNNRNLDMRTEKGNIKCGESRCWLPTHPLRSKRTVQTHRFTHHGAKATTRSRSL